MGHWFALRFMQEGHDVDIFYDGKKNNNNIRVLEGLVPEPFTEQPDFGRYDLVLFEMTGRPKLAEAASLETLVLGDSEIASIIEDDRLSGITVMENCGINIPPYETFNDLGEAKAFVKKNKKAYAFKPSGSDQETAATYVAKSPEDLLKYLDKLSELSKHEEFILQEVVKGTEVSTEGWFNGKEFFLINSTLEEKKFMNDNHGPNTGCAGNLVFLHDILNPPLVFREGLQKMTEFLQQYDYRGMIDLNTIVSETQLYGLEWTPRIGYDATATLFHTISSDITDLLGDIASGGRPVYQVKHKYAASVRLSIPPYPSEIDNKHPEDVPIQGLEDEKNIYRTHFLYDARLNEKEELVTAGVSGFIGTPIAGSDTIYEAFYKCNDRLERIQVPDLQFRTDIRDSVVKRFNALSTQGWLR